MKIGMGSGYAGLQILGIIVVLFSGATEAKLKMNFYKSSCPQAEKLVRDYVKYHVGRVPSLAPTLLRMDFHDCFVRGCDGSVLLNSTAASGNQTEKTATPNLTLRAYSFIDRLKSVVEAECPGVVSCADLIALSARDSIVFTGGPYWNVPTGRRDGRESNASEALAQIPGPTSNYTTLVRLFANKGLNVTDLVLLSGAHTVGIAHCSSLTNRLYNFTGVGDQDPALDSEYAANLQQYKCRTSTDNTTILEMDPGSARTFDLGYYGQLLKRRGLFQSDAALTTNGATAAFVARLHAGRLDNFLSAFARSMEKMGRISPKTGSSGEIRRHCAVVNS